MDEYNYKKNFIYDLTATVAFLATYYVMMPVIPAYMLQTGFDKLTIGFVLGLFSVSSLISRPLGGTWVDVIGCRKLMMLSIALFFLTPALFKVSMGLLGMSLAQLLYGFTVGGFTVAATTFVADISSSQNVAQFMGFHSIACITAKGLAPALGVKLMETYGFEGAVVSTLILAFIAGIFVFLLKDITIERKKDQHFSFFEVLLKKGVYIPTLVLFCGLVTFGAISAMMPVFAHERQINGIEYFFMINTATVVCTRLIMGRWSNKYLEQLVAVSLIILTLSFLSMSVVFNLNQLVAVAVLYGFGYAILFPMLSALLVLNVPKTYRGMALGIYTAAFDLGVAAGAMLGGLSKFISFKWVYLLLSIVPLMGYFLFQYAYRPYIEKESINVEMKINI